MINNYDNEAYPVASATQQHLQPTVISATPVGNDSPNNAPNNNTNNYDKELNPHTKRQLGGAAVAGGLAGLVVGGPVLGVLAAGGAALAVTSKGGAGKVARNCGDAMATAGDRLKKIDQKHHVVKKTSKGVVKSCKWVSKRLQPRPDSMAATTPPPTTRPNATHDAQMV